MKEDEVRWQKARRVHCIDERIETGAGVVDYDYRGEARAVRAGFFQLSCFSSSSFFPFPLRLEWSSSTTGPRIGLSFSSINQTGGPDFQKPIQQGARHILGLLGLLSSRRGRGCPIDYWEAWHPSSLALDQRAATWSFFGSVHSSWSPTHSSGRFVWRNAGKLSNLAKSDDDKEGMTGFQLGTVSAFESTTWEEDTQKTVKRITELFDWQDMFDSVWISHVFLSLSIGRFVVQYWPWKTADCGSYQDVKIL